MNTYGKYHGDVKLTTLEKKARRSAKAGCKHIPAYDWLWEEAWLKGYRAGLKTKK